MLYAKIVLGIPVEGPFDYIVPVEFSKRIKVGIRVRVDFRAKESVGYVVGFSQKSRIKNIKPILGILDETPILDKNMLLLTKELSQYYCCSWGEAIETAIPEALRKGRKIPNIIETRQVRAKVNSEAILVHDLDGRARWDIYLNSIKETLDNNKSTIVMLADINSVFAARDIIIKRLGVEPVLLYRKQPKEISQWLKIKKEKGGVVVGTRSSIFAPLNNLGLVIINEEQDRVYKQDQVPHYHARVVAFMRTKLENAKLILGSSSPSLESFYLAKRLKIKYIFIPRSKDFPEIKIIDTREILSKYLKDALATNLNSKGTTLLFLNRKGFATLASCLTCGTVLRCPRCNVNLVYHFKNNILNCHYCNFRISPPTICPNCNSGYIKYSGIGTEKIESELSRIFAQARIKRLDEEKHTNINEADIFISTKSIIKELDYHFGLIGVLAIDNSLNRIDFRAAEKTAELLIGLLGLAEKKIIIQTQLGYHQIFRALQDKNINRFYEEELKQRKELEFPPYTHLGLVKLRGLKETRVKEISEKLFNRLKRYAKGKGIKVVSVNPAQPKRLRGSFYWQILVKSSNPKKMAKFLKIHLKNFWHSGIIVTVDIDPV